MKKERKKEIGHYVLSSLTILGISLIFSLLGLIFIVDKIPKWVQFVISLVFMAPVFYIVFTQGRAQGERLFKASVKTTLNDLHNESGMYIPYYKCVFHVLGFVLPMVILTCISVICNSTGVRAVVLLFAFPIALLFSSVGILPLHTGVVTPRTLAIFLPYTFLLAGVFISGFLLKIYTLKRQHGDIANEIRMFDN